MTRLHERLRTDLPVEAAFDFIADFANSHAWDPGTAWSRRSEPRDGPVSLGTAFELGRGGLREGAALELAGARDAIKAA